MNIKSTRISAGSYVVEDGNGNSVWVEKNSRTGDWEAWDRTGSALAGVFYERALKRDIMSLVKYSFEVTEKEKEEKEFASVGEPATNVVKFPSPVTFDDDDAIVERALEILNRRLEEKKGGTLLNNPDKVEDFIRLKIADLDHEVLYAFFLNNKYELIEHKTLFRGTFDSSAIYPREVVKEALNCNASALVIAHNHPSGWTSASSADDHATALIKDALKTVGVRLLDHVIVGREASYSYSRHGKI